MKPQADEPQPETQTTTTEAGGPAGQPAPDEMLAVLRRIERALEEIRGRLETTARAQQHREFSLARLLAALCEALAVGLVIIALAGWIYDVPPGKLLVELALAGVLQLGALTAGLMGRESH
jgi:hypothetical protein